MPDKVVDNGEIVCGFAVRKNYEGQKDFDQTYKEITIKKRVKKIGDGDEDFIIEEFEEVNETPIKDVLAAQMDSVGIEAYMRPYLMAGQELPDIQVGEGIQDFTQFPEEPADVMKVGDEMMSTFNNLDPALRGDAKSVEEFLAGLTDEKLKNYLLSKVNVGKVEDKVNE